MPKFHLNGIDYFYRDEGAGPLVILAHAAAATSGQWKTLMERLAGAFRVIAFDLAGQGRSTPLPADQGHSDLPDSDAILALADLGEGPVHLVGHSAGGMVTLEAAVRMAGRLASLTLVEPVLFHLLRDEGLAEAWREIETVARTVKERLRNGDPVQAMRGFVDYWSGAGSWDAMPDNLRDAAVGTAARVDWGFDASFALTTTLEEYARLTVPTLLVRGTRTTLAAGSIVELLAGRLPNARMVEIEGAGHMSVLTHRDSVAEQIAQHLFSLR